MEVDTFRNVVSVANLSFKEENVIEPVGEGEVSRAQTVSTEANTRLKRIDNPLFSLSIQLLMIVSCNVAFP